MDGISSTATLWFGLLNLNVKVKTEPLYGAEMKPISPSYCLTIYWEITRPRPIPFLFILLVLLKNPKSLKSLFWSSNGMPEPVSLTLIFRNSSFSCVTSSSTSIISTWIETVPFLVNFRALDCRPKRTCITLCSSVVMIGLLRSLLLLSSC